MKKRWFQVQVLEADLAYVSGLRTRVLTYVAEDRKA